MVPSLDFFDEWLDEEDEFVFDPLVLLDELLALDDFDWLDSVDVEVDPESWFATLFPQPLSEKARMAETKTTPIPLDTFN